MSSLYLCDDISRVGREGHHLLIRNGHDVVTIPLVEIDSVTVIGNPRISNAAIDSLIREGTSITYLSSHGRFRGRWNGATTGTIERRMSQYSRFNDESFLRRFACGIVTSKPTSMRSVLRHVRKHDHQSAIEQALRLLEPWKRRTCCAENLDAIRGCEGAASAVYWRAYSSWILPPFRFTKRIRRPPTDPVNALLSFFATLLTTRILSLVDAAGLDPYLGALHATANNKPSLALDLMEPYRAPVVERFVARLCNLGMVKPEEFNQPDDRGVRLKDASLKRLLNHWEDWITRPRRGLDGIGYWELWRRETDRLTKALETGEQFVSWPGEHDADRNQL